MERNLGNICFKIGDVVKFQDEDGGDVGGVVFSEFTDKTPLGILTDCEIWKYTEAERRIIFNGDDLANRKAYFYALDGKNVTSAI